MKRKGKRALTPKLRFPEFRDAGEWKSDLIAGVATISKGRGISKADVAEDGTTPCIRYAELYTLYDEVINEVRSCTNIPLAELVLSQAEDVILPASGETRADIATAACVMREGVALGSDLNILRSDLRGPFFSYLLNSPLRYKIAQVAQGDTVAHLYPSQISKISITFPHPAEQQKIAECVSSLDGLIAAEGRMLEALKAHKKGLMQQLFPQPGQTQPRLRFPEFRDGPEWRAELLGDLFDTATGGTPDRSTKAYWGGSIPWTTTSLLDSNVIYNTKEFISEQGLANSSAKLFSPGTVLIALYGQGKTRGKVALLGIESTTNQACAAVMPREGVDPTFAFLNLAGRYDEIRSLSNSGGQDNLSQGLVQQLAFGYPEDTTEQQKVVACLTALNTRIAAQAAKIDALKQHKRGLMQQLFPAPEEQ